MADGTKITPIRFTPEDLELIEEIRSFRKLPTVASVLRTLIGVDIKRIRKIRRKSGKTT